MLCSSQYQMFAPKNVHRSFILTKQQLEVKKGLIIIERIFSIFREYLFLHTGNTRRSVKERSLIFFCNREKPGTRFSIEQKLVFCSNKPREIKEWTEKLTFQYSKLNLSEYTNDTIFDIHVYMHKFYWLELRFGFQSQQHWKSILNIFSFRASW